MTDANHSTQAARAGDGNEPAAWQERQEVRPGVFGKWYDKPSGWSLTRPGEIDSGGIRYQFRPLYAAAPAVPVQIPAGWFEGPHGAFRANPAFKMDWPPKALQWQIPLYLVAPAAAPAWQPIETAPKDMASRLYLCDGVIVEGFRDATGTLCVRQEGETAWRRMRWEPSHWMPRPANPVSPSATVEGSQP